MNVGIVRRSLHEGKKASLNHPYEGNNQGTLYPSVRVKGNACTWPKSSGIAQGPYDHIIQGNLL